MSKKVRNCKLCRENVRKDGYDNHLMEVHSAVEIGGMVFTVSRWHWRRFFSDG